MRARALATLAASLLMIALAAAPALGEDLAGGRISPGPQGFEIGAARRQLWLVPLPGERLLMHTIVLRPQGDGPFPLAVINHGSNQNSVLRATFNLSAYHKLAYWFLAHGYAVALPIRPGHGATGGPYFEDQGRCHDVNYRKSGLATANSIQAAVDYLTAQRFIRKSNVLIVGQSAGGWGALALASRNPPAGRAVINFAGGRGGRVDDQPGRNCAPDRLVAAAGDFGRTARIPTLWLYSQNDSYFAPALSKRIFAAFRGAGGTGDYYLLPPTGADGHILINSDNAIALWAPIVERFLQSVPNKTPMSPIARRLAITPIAPPNINPVR
jgi:dienelactone hydrolase